MLQFGSNDYEVLEEFQYNIFSKSNSLKLKCASEIAQL